MTTTQTFAHLFTADTTADDYLAAYRAADAGTKGRMRAAIKEAISAAVMTDFPLAQHLVGLENAVKSAAPTKTEPTVDYVAKVRDLRATLVAAVAAIDNGEVTFPTGVTVNLLDHDLTGGTADDKRVADLTKVTGRKVGRGNVPAYIDSVLGDEPMTISQLAAAWTPSDNYPNEAPSTGAIGACLDRVANGAEAPFSTIMHDGVKAAVRS